MSGFSVMHEPLADTRLFLRMEMIRMKKPAAAEGGAEAEEAGADLAEEVGSACYYYSVSSNIQLGHTVRTTRHAT